MLSYWYKTIFCEIYYNYENLQVLKFKAFFGKTVLVVHI